MPLFVKSAQIAYFLGSIDLSDRLKVAELIKKELGDILDGTPTILPIPDDAPLEIPRVIFPSKNNEFVCNVAVNRFDFIQKVPDEKNGIEFKLFKEELSKRVTKLNKLLFEELKATGNRLGLILNYNAIPKEGGLNFLKKIYLGSSKDISTELQLHKLTQGTIGDMKINNWIRLVASNKQLAAGDRLVVISDINTSQSEKYALTKDTTEKFFADAVEVSLKSIEEMLSQEN